MKKDFKEERKGLAVEGFIVGNMLRFVTTGPGNSLAGFLPINGIILGFLPPFG